PTVLCCFNCPLRFWYIIRLRQSCRTMRLQLPILQHEDYSVVLTDNTQLLVLALIQKDLPDRWLQNNLWTDLSDLRSRRLRNHRPMTDVLTSHDNRTSHWLTPDQLITTHRGCTKSLSARLKDA